MKKIILFLMLTLSINATIFCSKAPVADHKSKALAYVTVNNRFNPENPQIISICATLADTSLSKSEIWQKRSKLSTDYCVLKPLFKKPDARISKRHLATPLFTTKLSDHNAPTERISDETQTLFQAAIDSAWTQAKKQRKTLTVWRYDTDGNSTLISQRKADKEKEQENNSDDDNVPLSQLATQPMDEDED